MAEERRSGKRLGSVREAIKEEGREKNGRGKIPIHNFLSPKPWVKLPLVHMHIDAETLSTTFQRFAHVLASVYQSQSVVFITNDARRREP